MSEELPEWVVRLRDKNTLDVTECPACKVRIRLEWNGQEWEPPYTCKSCGSTFRWHKQEFLGNQEISWFMGMCDTSTRPLDRIQNTVRIRGCSEDSVDFVVGALSMAFNDGEFDTREEAYLFGAELLEGGDAFNPAGSESRGGRVYDRNRDEVAMKIIQEVTKEQGQCGKTNA